MRANSSASAWLSVAAGGQRAAQEGDQAVQHGLCACWLKADQHAQIGQGVEQHMRLELRLQQPQLRFGQFALRRLGAQLHGRGAPLRRPDEDRHQGGQQ
jgi:hypothetical protein